MWYKFVFILFILFTINGCKDNNREFRKACALGNIKVVKELIKSKTVDLNKQVKGNGATPLMLAANKGHCEIVSLLITEGANIHIKDGANLTALLMACAPGAKTPNKTIEILLQNGASPNIKSFGKTPLMVSVFWDNLYNVKILLKYGANVNIVSDDGQTALDIALERLKSRLSPQKKEIVNKIINVLKKHGAKTVAEL